MTEAWIKARDRLPDTSTPVLCVLTMNDQADYAHWQAVLHRKDGKWHDENDVSTSDWHMVLWWRPLDWPEKQ